jgi:hypothetical protein
LLYVYIINCEVLTIEDVLGLAIPICKRDKDCPSNSRGCIYENCFFKFYCRNNECISSTNTTYFYSNSNLSYKKKKNRSKGIIYDVCSEGAIRIKKCSTPKCNTNEDCFSNNCLNHICMTNDALPIIKCNNNFINGTIAMKCSKNVYEKCETDNECFSENCTKEKFCSNKINNLPKYKKTALFILNVFLSLCTLSLIIYSVIFCWEHCCQMPKEEIYEEEENEEEKEENLSKEIINENMKIDSEQTNKNERNTVNSAKNEKMIDVKIGIEE